MITPKREAEIALAESVQHLRDKAHIHPTAIGHCVQCVRSHRIVIAALLGFAAGVLTVVGVLFYIAGGAQ